MNETFILFAGETPDDPVSWAVIGEGALLRADAAGSLEEIRDIADRFQAAGSVVCVLRGELAAMRGLASPPKSMTQFRAAASLLLEDELAEGPDQLHMAIQKRSDAVGLVLALKKPVFEMWLERFRAVGLDPDIVTVDIALLPLTQGRALLIETQDRVLGAVGYDGFALDCQLAETLLPGLIGGRDIQKLVVSASRQLPVSAPESVEIERQPMMTPEALTGFFAETIESRDAPNLLQGAYRKKSDWKKARAPWRRAGLMAAAVAGAVLVSGVVDAMRSLRIAETVRSETLELHRAAFPEAAAENPREHARRVLAASGSRPAFIQVTNALADSARETAGVDISRIRYNAARNEYSVNLRFSDIAQFEALKRALGTRGYVASETGSVRRTGGSYFGELQVSAS